MNLTNDDERTAAESMMRRFVDSLNRADGEAYGQNYWPDELSRKYYREAGLDAQQLDLLIR